MKRAIPVSVVQRQEREGLDYGAEDRTVLNGDGVRQDRSGIGHAFLPEPLFERGNALFPEPLGARLKDEDRSAQRARKRPPLAYLPFSSDNVNPLGTRTEFLFWYGEK